MNGIKAIFNHNVKDIGVQRVYDEARFLEPVITEDLLEITKRLDTKLNGLEYSVKTGSSVEDKLERKHEICNKTGQPYNAIDTINEMVDLVRYTQICNHDDIIDITNRTIKSLQEKGYELIAVKNYYAEPYKTTGYMGIHLNFVSPYGQKMELQVHSEESYEVKQKGHDIYEKIRAVSTPEEEKDKLKIEIFKIHQSISKPQKFTELKDYQVNPEQIKVIVDKKKEQTKIEVKKSTHHLVKSSIVYSIYKAGKLVSYGFENTHSDDSVFKHINVGKKNIIIGVNKNEIIGYKAKESYPLLSKNDALQIGVQMEEEHKNWMEQNMTIKEDRPIADFHKQYSKETPLKMPELDRGLFIDDSFSVKSNVTPKFKTPKKQIDKDDHTL